ncbi:MAG: ABC transporter permease [Gemmatimonadales bacterium]|nr:ABC transporter permease [Gemmatimonadales bacterium]
MDQTARVTGEHRVPLPYSVRISHAFGRPAVGALEHVGRLGMLVVELVRALPEYRVWFPRAIEQCMSVGYGSLFLIIITSGFVGGVTAIQAGYQFTGNIPLYLVGTVITESMILEMGPVFTGLLLAGRIGARYAAELGTMRVTEQIDALESLGRNPVSHLILPRVLAGLLMVPALVVVADVTGIITGWWAAKRTLGITDYDFAYGSRYFFRTFDIWYSVIKAEAFGAVVTIVPCYVGVSVTEGAEGVGRAATRAVVAASVLILLLDVVLAKVLLPS